MRTLVTSLIPMLAVWLVGCSSADPTAHTRTHTPYAEARSAATANGETTDGQFYEIDFAERLSVLMTTAPDRYLTCFRGVTEPVDVVLLLDAEGRVLEVGTRDDSPPQRCFARAVASERFPPPPADQWWTHISMSGRQRGPDAPRD